MNHAQLFTEIMRYLWGDDGESVSFTIRAIGDRLVGTQHCNHENAFDVLNKVFAGQVRSCIPRSSLVDERYIFDVTFTDDSQCMILASLGIGSALE